MEIWLDRGKEAEGHALGCSSASECFPPRALGLLYSSEHLMLPPTWDAVEVTQASAARLARPPSLVFCVTSPYEHGSGMNRVLS